MNHHMLAAKKGEEMRDAPAIRVEKRNGVQFDGSAFDVESQANVHRVKIYISVREHYTLGIGAGSAGVEKLGKSVFINSGDIGAVWLSFAKKVFVTTRRQPGRFWRAFEQADHFYRRNVVAKRLHQAEQLLFNEKNFCPGMVQDGIQFIRLYPEVEW